MCGWVRGRVDEGGAERACVWAGGSGWQVRACGCDTPARPPCPPHPHIHPRTSTPCPPVSTMYACFITSGLVDLAGHYLGAPQGIDLVRERPPASRGREAAEGRARGGGGGGMRQSAAASAAPCPPPMHPATHPPVPHIHPPTHAPTPLAAPGLPGACFHGGGAAAGVPPQGPPHRDPGASDPGAAGERSLAMRGRSWFCVRVGRRAERGGEEGREGAWLATGILAPLPACLTAPLTRPPTHPPTHSHAALPLLLLLLLPGVWHGGGDCG